jgi:AraC family transcriptional regulator
MNMATLDQQTYQLAMAFKDALQTAEGEKPESFYQLGLRLCQHLIVQYQGTGQEQVSNVREQVALAPWQERRAKQILATARQDKLLIAEVASQCAMSRSHFSRAFKKTTGMSPQEWSLKSRIEHAQRLLTEGALSMCEIALECGFADQSHFSRTFSKLTGTAPKRWQRSQPTSLQVA